MAADKKSTDKIIVQRGWLLMLLRHLADAREEMIRLKSDDLYQLDNVITYIEDKLA